MRFDCRRKNVADQNEVRGDMRLQLNRPCSCVRECVSFELPSNIDSTTVVLQFREAVSQKRKQRRIRFDS